MQLIKALKQQPAGQLFLACLVAAAIALAVMSYTIINEINAVKQSWDQVVDEKSSKMRAISHLRRDLGYGGMIHHYKNLILRGHNKHYDSYRESMGAASASILEYRELNINAAEIKALEALSVTLNHYRQAGGGN